MTNSAAILEQPGTLSGDVVEQLRIAARAALSWDVVHRPEGPTAFRARQTDALRSLKRIEVALAASLKETNTPVSPRDAALFEMMQNRRMLRSAIVSVSRNHRGIARLPRIVGPGQNEEPRVAGVARLYLQTVGGVFSSATFLAFTSELQAHESLQLDELWNLSSFLQFTVLEMLVTEARRLLDRPDSSTLPLVSLHIKTLRAIAKAKWSLLVEQLLEFESTLCQDPAGAYASMDFESREHYRKRVAFLALHSDCTESEVARHTLALAREAESKQVADQRVHRRRMHVGYYLCDKGLPHLTPRIGFHAPLIDRIRRFVREHADLFYITGIQLITILFIAVLVAPSLGDSSVLGIFIAAALLIFPTSQSAVDLVNKTVTALFDPHPLPKLDFSKGVDANCATLVAVPALLLKEEQVHELVTSLEVRFLGNRDPNIHFALLTDLPDSKTKPREKDNHPLVDLAVRLIDELNAKYSRSRRGSFLFLHRHRIFNRKQGVWMGWERKRGKLLDLNKLMTGEFDAFPIKAGSVGLLRSIRYVITLDADTQLPRGSAAKLIGAMAHPLNQAIIDPAQRIVVEGYGILQPRIGVAVHSASRSRLASIYSGQSGLDPYTRAVSDTYQELYGEGSFTGKGIYEVAAVHTVLGHRFPLNSLLSHDLIEGAYARAGFVSDIELIDDYPSHLSAYSRRKHRWVRGDWQVAPWMFSHVPDESGHSVLNPISDVSRWKILDNLRRSLLEPFTLILLVAGWLGLPGGPLYWTSVSLLLLIVPIVVQLVFGICRAFITSHVSEALHVFEKFMKEILIVFLNLVYLPHQTLLMLDAIVRALIRQYGTGERLLEWETAAEAESSSSKQTPAESYLVLSPLVAVVIAVAIAIFNPSGKAIQLAAPFLALWTCASLVKLWLNAPPREEKAKLTRAEEDFLLEHALRIWRFFAQYGGEHHNYLIPDNVEEDGFFEAARVSPTNLGFLLNARQAACEFGFLTVPEFVTLTCQTMATVGRMKKHRGHLVNWYSTQTLDPLGPDQFISSVDSGNLAASLLTLCAGARDLLQRPLAPLQLFSGVSAHRRLARLHNEEPAEFAVHPVPVASAPFEEWVSWIVNDHTARPPAQSDPDGDNNNLKKNPWWLAESERRVSAIVELLEAFMPWLLPEHTELRELPELGITSEVAQLSIEDAINFAATLVEDIARVQAALPAEHRLSASAQRLGKALPDALRNLQDLASGLRWIADQAEQMVNEMEFSFLVSQEQELLSIGFNVNSHQLHESCYGVLASEARIAAFLAIARGDLPQQSWFNLGREQTCQHGRFLLMSWTGTMFEYLMPALWMRRYKNTLIEDTLHSCVYLQRAFARKLTIPWGISESGTSRKDAAGHYQYQAYGIPQIALSPDATAGPVVSPYSTFLALGVDSRAALRNLRRMAADGVVGAFGFYEALDYSLSSRKPTIVREWMAHHQGMSLLSILNLLNDNIVQRWFHAAPMIQATEMLLEERPTRGSVLRAELNTLGEAGSHAHVA